MSCLGITNNVVLISPRYNRYSVMIGTKKVVFEKGKPVECNLSFAAKLAKMALSNGDPIFSVTGIVSKEGEIKKNVKVTIDSSGEASALEAKSKAKEKERLRLKEKKKTEINECEDSSLFSFSDIDTFTTEDDRI